MTVSSVLPPIRLAEETMGLTAEAGKTTPRKRPSSDRMESFTAPSGVGGLRFAGLILSGLDLSKLREGTLRISLPLEAGTYWFPGLYSKAEIKIPKNTNLSAELSLGRDADGRLIIAKATISVNNPLVVKNPVAATQPPSTNWFAKAIEWDHFKDMFVSLILRGITVDKNGDILLDGQLDKTVFSRTALRDLIGPEDLPTVDTHVDALLSDSESTAKSMPLLVQKLIKKWTPAVWLSSLGNLTRAGSFSFRAVTDKVSLDMRSKDVHMWTGRDAVEADIRGSIRVNPEGSLQLIADGKKSSVSLPTGLVRVDGEMLATDIPSGRPGLALRAGLSASVEGVRGTVKMDDGSEVPLTVGHDGDKIGAQLFVKRSKEGVVDVLPASSARVDVTTKVDERSPIRFGGIRASMSDGSIRLRSGINFERDQESFQIKSGFARFTGKITDPEVDAYGVRGRVEGELTADIEATELEYDGDDEETRGQVKYTLAPSESVLKKFPFVKPMTGGVGFKLQDNGRLQLRDVNHTLTEFLSPFVTLVDDADTIVDPKSEPIGEVGSTRLKTHLAALTGSPIRTNNRVTLLTDGVQSMPARLEMIKNSRESILLQTLIFKNDESGLIIAKALITARKRGVEVKVIIDALGNTQKMDDLIAANPIYDLLRKGGVDLRLYNDVSEDALKELIGILSRHPEIGEGSGLDSIKDPKKIIKLLNKVARLAQGKLSSTLTETERGQLQKALATLMGKKTDEATEEVVSQLAEFREGGVISSSEILTTARRIAELNHRWHEKYLIVDGNRAIVGGMNIADEYLLGGTTRRVSIGEKERPAWRDTDVLIEGPGARDAYRSFGRNWTHITGKVLPLPAPAERVEISASKGGGVEVQMLQHRPGIEQGHPIENWMIENIKALKAGERCTIANAYFLPTGAVERYKEALIDAAKRGVEVRVLTNSLETTDSPHVSQASVFLYRELLAAGVRIFERTGDRLMHQKVAVFGSRVASIGSWNADNRSASINSECMAAIYSSRFAEQMESTVMEDMRTEAAPDKPAVAKEIRLEDVAALPWRKELEYSAVALLSNFL